MNIPAETVLTLGLAVLIGLFAFITSWFEAKNKEVGQITDQKERSLLSVELTKAYIQVLSIIGLGVTAIVSWNQIAQSDEHKVRASIAEQLPSVVEHLASKAAEERIAALLALDDFAQRDPEMFNRVLSHYLSIVQARVEAGCNNPPNEKEDIVMLEREIVKEVANRHGVVLSCNAAS